jgi:hypothetical protein
MAHKVLLTWNIQSGIEREHFQRIRVFVSKLAGLGLNLAEAWYTAYGDAPHVLLGIVAAGGQEDQLQNVLDSEEWGELLAELRPYISDYKQRIVKVEGQFQF